MHPSVFELHLFVTRGETSEDFERHVSTCDACARRLSTFAARVAAPVLTVAPPVERHFLAAAVALVACLSVLAVRTVTLPRIDGAPEGVHGVSLSPAFEPPPGGDVRSIALDSGVLSPPS